MLSLGIFLFLWLSATLVAQTVSPQHLNDAARDTSSWLSYGRDLLGQRYVELNQITPKNVRRLHPAWVFATGGENRGLQATPLVHNGVIYLSADGSRVFAIDARTGAKKWSWDPKIERETERVYCCGAINRGLAMLGDYRLHWNARCAAGRSKEGHGRSRVGDAGV